MKTLFELVDCNKCYNEGRFSVCGHCEEGIAHGSCDDSRERECKCWSQRMALREPWKLWLDDQLDDPEAKSRHTPDGWVGIKSSYEAIKHCETYGYPIEMSLDFDLGGNDTAMTFLNFLIREFCDYTPPVYRFHTRNPVGREMMQSKMTWWVDRVLRKAKDALLREEIRNEGKED